MISFMISVVPPKIHAFKNCADSPPMSLLTRLTSERTIDCDPGFASARRLGLLSVTDLSSGY